MPQYTYKCGLCNSKFALHSSIKDYTETVICVSCGQHKACRHYPSDMPTISGSIKLAKSEIKTLGHLAQRNAEIMSEDQKNELYRKHNSYKEDVPENPLPKGMQRIKKQKKIQWTDNKKIRRNQSGR